MYSLNSADLCVNEKVWQEGVSEHFDAAVGTFASSAFVRL